MKPGSGEPIRYSAIGARNVAQTPEWNRLGLDVREAVEVVSRVLPFRTNRYVMESLIDWSKAPDDPIFQLVFPQRDMLWPEQYREIQSSLRRGESKASLDAIIQRIRLDLNPQPAGQVTHNVPIFDGRPLWGLQHKYRETVLFFPFEAQSCHSYCTYCFRWAQFVDMEGMRFACNDATGLVAYLKAHPDITDVLITGGDPMIMRASLLRKYIQPLLSPELAHVQNIRIGTKAVASWPHRFVTDPDADECLRLFEEVTAANRHLAIMAHYAHPIELEPEIARQAVRRIRNTGAVIRMQAPVVRHVNNDPELWATLWRNGVRLGLIPYYMFVERDTGARNYFEIPLFEAYEIYRQAYSRVSGLARSAQGPSMSAFPGKVRILGVVPIREIFDGRTVEALRNTGNIAPVVEPEDRVFVCDFIQARDPSLARSIFFAAMDRRAVWFDQLRPAFGKASFGFQRAPDRDMELNLPSYAVTESLLN